MSPTALSHVKALVARRDRTRGLLIALEGPDGAGKTTQRKLLRAWLQSHGHAVTCTRWADSPLVRPLLTVRKRIHALSPEEYSLLHAADFRHRLDTDVLPALWAGRTVVADRYLFTALARDAARGLDLDWLLQVYAPLLWPDVVIYLALSAEVSGRRIAAMRAPRFYESGQDVTGVADPVASYRQFITRVSAEYEQLATIFRFVTIDAAAPVFRQHQALRSLVEQTDKRGWMEFSFDAVAEWLREHPEAGERRD